MKRLLPLILLLMLAIPAQGQETCTALVGMSQISQLYTGTTFTGPFSIPAPGQSQLEQLTGDEWMLIFKGGKSLYWWVYDANWDTAVIDDRCAADAQISRIVFGFDPKPGTPAKMLTLLDQVVAVIHDRYPAADIGLMMLVGSTDHAPCTFNGQPIQAAATHASYIDDLQAAAGRWGPDVHISVDIEIACTEFSDAKGHLTGPGAVNGQTQLANFYNG